MAKSNGIPQCCTARECPKNGQIQWNPPVLYSQGMPWLSHHTAPGTAIHTLILNTIQKWINENKFKYLSFNNYNSIFYEENYLQ